MNLKTVCAVVVTYNRCEYLLKLLYKLKCQSYNLNGILIFDNHSSDETEQKLINEGYCYKTKENNLSILKEDEMTYYYYRNSENSGGSGGFHDAMKIASSFGYDYLWCMDDDVCPDQYCLEKLMEHISEKVRICIPTRTDENYQDFAVTNVNMSNPFLYNIVSRKTMVYNNLIKGNTIKVVDMPFEGPLISNELIKEIGLPKAEFFIIFDDSEYAARANKNTEILYCKDAILHKQIIPSSSFKNVLMNWKNYYGYRNQIWFDRCYGENKFVKVIRPRLLFIDIVLRALIKRKYSNINVIKKAYKDGMSGKLGKLVEPGTVGKDIK